MIAVFNFLFLILGSLFLFILVYLFFLAIISLCPQRKRSHEFPSKTKFAVVIPAHNESRVIGNTLDSLQKLDYPENLYDIFVIADNCEDNTAEIVHQKGIVCWKRQDLQHIGKGYVLKQAFERLLKEGNHGAYVVIDADTLVDRNFLMSMNKHIMGGAKAIQGYYDVLNPERSPMGSLSYLGFVLSRNLRYRGRTRLGWTTNLLGNGMCFTREVIEKFGWSATSIVEDIEYEMFLLLHSVKVVFAPEARIYAEIPDTFRKSKVQRSRWDIGKFEIRNRYLLKLVLEGMKKRDLSYFDASLELIIPPFSLFVIIVIACFLLFITYIYKEPSLDFYIWISVISVLGIYIMLGLVRAHASWKVYRNLAYAPYFLAWRFWLILKELWNKNQKAWIKTERK